MVAPWTGWRRALLELSDPSGRARRRGVVLAPLDGRVHLVANVAPEVVERGVSAGEVVRVAAQVSAVGRGRDTMAQAGGRDPEKLPEAMATAPLRDGEGPRAAG